MSDSDHNETNDFHKEQLPKGVVLKEHSYDGIHEYDQRLPRWWLITLFGAMLFATAYWFLLDVKGYWGRDKPELEARLQEIQAKKLAGSIDVTNNELFWEMSQNPTFVTAGQETFESLCVACHGKELQGGIGFNLVDGEWVHGAAPSSVYNTIFNGVPDKGMQAWGGQLGQKRITQVVAYVLSKNDRATMEAAPVQ
ncbi:cbb3-type cytochrome c oxidase N-terminal domain-containing protein [Coraliomargarita akajimensis]|uniref:Cytochrome c class I n=1 Tax=Coraliomargarita akajimensis (strain DSM 45221 / IAM 15411 / JCM 23193 / KCTC 12865 / 04OKA010-24) TaxID=583355 RepID=D5EJ85_CORAD|nr:cbb3-type cytochrome c oxidase N-terminal domain-containing protein [Coraliomargarita akajimensis]ADE54484.1 cytochrome c class I [Coraliomargarita akajimensis DSM 45221]